MDRLQTLNVFARVAEMESFTAAAKSLGLPKASASNAVAQLEARLGTRLLHRTTRRVSLTQDGTVFYERCKDLLTDVDEVETMFKASEAALSGRIRVDLPTRLARFHVIPRLRQLLDEHPDLVLELGSTDRAVDLVREGYDCVVRVGTVADSAIVARRIGEYELINCASPAYLKRHGTPRGLKDLERHKLVHYVGTLGAKPDGFEYFNGSEWVELPMQGRITVNNTDAYTAAAVAGLGIIQVPNTGPLDDLRERRLVEILPGLKARPMPVSILFPHRRQLSRRVRVFIEWLEGILKPLLQTRVRVGS